LHSELQKGETIWIGYSKGLIISGYRQYGMSCIETLVLMHPTHSNPIADPAHNSILSCHYLIVIDRSMIVIIHNPTIPLHIDVA